MTDRRSIAWRELEASARSSRTPAGERGPWWGSALEDGPDPDPGSEAWSDADSAAFVVGLDEVGGIEREPGVEIGAGADVAFGAEVDVDDVDVADLDLDLDLEVGTDEDADGTGWAGDRWVRMLRAAAVVGAAGWVIAVVVNLLSPSTLLDTTDRDDDAEIPVDGETEIGGGPVEEVGAVQLLDMRAFEGGEADGSAAVDAGDGSATADADDGGEAGVGTAAEAAAASAAAVGAGGAASGAGGAGAGAATASDYRSNLQLLRSGPARNTNHDASPYRDVAQAELVPSNLYGPRSDYLGNPAGNPEQAFPVPAGGQFRTSCEFSHFGYDDPLVHPNQPGASHLHMFFGNTDVNAFSTHESLINSGSSTCNGQELNRTGYWVPAMFDGQGNVRVPERVVVYYKGEGRSRGSSEVYPSGAAMIATENLNAAPSAEGGVGGQKLTFQCSDNFSTNTGNGSQTMASCDGSTFGADPNRWTVLEVNVKFPQCWNGQEPSDWANFAPPGGDWYGSNCTGEFGRNLPNLEYFVNYRVDPGENTADWFLSSDVDPTSFELSKGSSGASNHGDWWGGWHPETNRMWIDNCVNFATSAPSGCGMGYLTNGGPNGSAPADGPALRYRPDYTGPHKVSAATLFAELCPSADRQYRRPEDAAYCRPA